MSGVIWLTLTKYAKTFIQMFTENAADLRREKSKEMKEYHQFFNRGLQKCWNRPNPTFLFFGF